MRSTHRRELIKQQSKWEKKYELLLLIKNNHAMYETDTRHQRELNNNQNGTKSQNEKKN